MLARKVYACVVIIGLFLLVCSSVLAQTYTVTAPRASVRTGPSSDHPVRTEVTRDAVFPILETHQGWAKILLDDGSEGWMAPPVSPPKARAVTQAVQDRSAATTSQPRVALVIGNATYQASPLRNPVNDASNISDSLERLGFQVTRLLDADHRTMETAIRQFGRALRQGGTGLFYYAGHGMQVGGVNYLIPIGARLEEEADIKWEAVDVRWVLAIMDEEEVKDRVNIVILDACRNNPFSRGWRRTRGAQEKGLTEVTAAQGTLIAYATAPGSEAADGEGENGLYTQHLLEQMQIPGQSVERMFKQVRVKVIQDSGGEQTPWESSSLTVDFSFQPASSVSERFHSGQGGNPPPVAVAGAGDIEVETWAVVKDTMHKALLVAFLHEYPNGRYGRLARVRLRALEIAELEVVQRSTRLKVTFVSQPTDVAYDKGNPTKVKYGDNLTVTASKQGYRSQTKTLENITTNQELAFALERITYTVRLRSETPGVDYDKPNPSRVPHGARFEVIASKDGYHDATAWRAKVTEDTTITFAALERQDVIQGSFRIHHNGTVTDTRTHLMWMTDDFRTMEGRAVRSWQEARRWAKKMNQQGSGGHSDWRVPTVKEYQQIYDRGRPRRSYKGHRLGWPSVFENGGGKIFLVE